MAKTTSTHLTRHAFPEPPTAPGQDKPSPPEWYTRTSMVLKAHGDADEPRDCSPFEEEDDD